eukprot:6814239-Prymnesium_polylepis.1
MVRRVTRYIVSNTGAQNPFVHMVEPYKYNTNTQQNTKQNGNTAGKLVDCLTPGWLYSSMLTRGIPTYQTGCLFPCVCARTSRHTQAARLGRSAGSRRGVAGSRKMKRW